MKRLLTPLVIVFGICAEPPPTSAAIPVRWRVETSRVQPAQFIAYHGETLRLEATLQSDGKPLDITNEALICWQTNGMGSTYWSAPAATSNNVLSAHFTPAMDPGADLVNGFLGIPGENWRAAFQLRLRPSPGVDPAALPLPVLNLDFSKVVVLNPPWADRTTADDVCNIVTNEVPEWEVRVLRIWDRDYYFEYGVQDVSYIQWTGDIAIEAGHNLAFLSVTNGATWPTAEIYAGTVRDSGDGIPFADIELRHRNRPRNALGLVMTNDLADVAFSGDYRKLNNKPVYNNTGVVVREISHDVAVTNVTLGSGQIFAGLAVIGTNLVGIVPVVGTTATVRVWAPYAEGHYTPNQFSAIEIGNQNQALFSQRMIAGTAIYCPSPSMLRFTSSLDPEDPQSTCTTLQDYLDALSPDTVAALMAGFVPADGDGVINGSLTVNGQIVANGAMVFTNADVKINGILDVGGCLLAAGMAVSDGTAHIQRINTPRIHIDNGTGAIDPYGNSLTNVTFGGTADQPYYNLREYIHNYVYEAIVADRSTIENMIRQIVDEYIQMREQEQEQTRGGEDMAYEQEEEMEEEMEEGREEAMEEDPGGELREEQEGEERSVESSEPEGI